MARFLALLYGVAAYVFFLGVFLYTIGWVEGVPGVKSIDGPVSSAPLNAVLVNTLLLGLFAVQHSVMARRGFKRWWTKIVPPVAERSTYVLAATLLVGLLVWQWQPIAGVVWSVNDGAAQVVLIGLSVFGWVLLLTSTFLINHFELFGLQQVVNNFMGVQVSSPSFRTPGPYKVVRHPLYLGFLFGFWATPHMTVGHLFFAIMCTGYILVGIFFEERDLVAHFGEEYRRYKRNVSMILPWFPKGERAVEPRGQSRIR